MRNNDLVVFIDSKGVSHNALVKAIREHRDERGELVHSEPLVTLTYNLPTGEPKEVIDVHHMDNPTKEEPNPGLPTYALHVWKHQEEEHLPVPSDHPLHDHPYEIQKLDAAGVPVPKRRPIYEKHIQWHKQSMDAKIPSYMREPAGNRLPGGPDDSVGDRTATGGVTQQLRGAVTKIGQRSPVTDPDPVGPGTQSPLNHPAHPDTIHFAHKCVSCGIPVHRVASHQGGKEWDIPAVDGQPWNPHVCKAEDIEAFRESLKPKKEPEMTELQKAALEPAGDPPKPEEKGFDAEIARDRQLLSEVDEHLKKALDQEIAATIPEPEVDVITELQNAPPAPDEPQSQGQNEGEQAEG